MSEERLSTMFQIWEECRRELSSASTHVLELARSTNSSTPDALMHDLMCIQMLLNRAYTKLMTDTQKYNEELQHITDVRNAIDMDMEEDISLAFAIWRDPQFTNLFFRLREDIDTAAQDAMAWRNWGVVLLDHMRAERERFLERIGMLRRMADRIAEEYAS